MKACLDATCGDCPRCRMRRAWADGKFAARRKPVRGDHWTPEEDDQLRAIAGTVPCEQLADAWRDRTGIARTFHALRIRAKRIGVSMWARGMSLTEVEMLFRLDHRAIERNWIRTGELPSKRWGGRGPNAGWWFETADVERFIRDRPWRYDWTRMQPGHRLTRVAELVNRADLWRTYDELAAYVGITTTNLDRWRRRGLVPHQFRPKAGGPRIMVRGRDFPAIRAAIRAARIDARGRTRNGRMAAA